MQRDKTGITGKVKLVVRDKDGKIKRFPRTLKQVINRQLGDPMIVINHNIVTNQGDALLVDALSTTPARTLPNNANAVIGVGTGYVSATKVITALVTQTGSDEAMDSGYPQQKGSWGAANDSVLVFKSTFEAGDLNSSGIDEVAVGNGTDNLAYAQIDPAINVTTADTLAVTWELTFLGA